MDIRRRSLFKMAAGGVLLATGSSLIAKENGFIWNLWHQLRYRVAMNAVPAQNTDIISKREDQETVLYSRSHQMDFLKLNPMAGRIWEMCDGSHRVSDIVRSIANRFDVVTSECTRDVLFTVSKLQQRGMIQI
ncbi:MAG: PqqD family protein [Syntrophales bacterium]